MTVIIPSGTRHLCAVTELQVSLCLTVSALRSLCFSTPSKVVCCQTKRQVFAAVFSTCDFLNLQDGRKLRPDTEALLLYLDEEFLL